jgi:hypothetical protein
MVLILEIAAGVFLGLLAFMAFWAWRTDRRIERQLENQMRGLTTDQLRMLRGIRDPAELSRIISNMHMVNDASRRLTESLPDSAPPDLANGHSRAVRADRAGLRLPQSPAAHFQHDC